MASGDCHGLNVGLLVAPGRSPVFDIDETRSAPWAWQVKRLAVSFAVAVRGKESTDARESDDFHGPARRARSQLWSFNGDIAGLPHPGRSGKAALEVTDRDGIVGVEGYLNLGAGCKWFIPCHVDIGSGPSGLGWRANAGFGYRLGWGAVVASWRCLDGGFKSGNPIESVNFNGALPGVSFHW